MEKLILENRTDLPMEVFLELATLVVKEGRISDMQYCYLTDFAIRNEQYHIVSEINKKPDKLILYKVPKRD